MADDDQNYAVFNSRMLVDTVGDITDEALKASRIKDIIGVLAGRIFNWGQRKSLFPLHLGIKCCALEMAAAGASRFDAERFGVFFRTKQNHFFTHIKFAIFKICTIWVKPEFKHTSWYMFCIFYLAFFL